MRNQKYYFYQYQNTFINYDQDEQNFSVKNDSQVKDHNKDIMDSTKEIERNHQIIKDQFESPRIAKRIISPTR